MSYGEFSETTHTPAPDPTQLTGVGCFLAT